MQLWTIRKLSREFRRSVYKDGQFRRRYHIIERRLQVLHQISSLMVTEVLAARQCNIESRYSLFESEGSGSFHCCSKMHRHRTVSREPKSSSHLDMTRRPIRSTSIIRGIHEPAMTHSQFYLKKTYSTVVRLSRGTCVMFGILTTSSCIWTTSDVECFPTPSNLL